MPRPFYAARNHLLTALKTLHPDTLDAWVSLTGYAHTSDGALVITGTTGRMERVEHTFPEDPFMVMFREEGES